MLQNYKQGDTITEADYLLLRKQLNDKYNIITKLEENKTVYFNKSVQISRTEFKKHFPTNKIVKILTDADYFITKTKPSLYISFYQNKTRILDENDFRWKSTLDTLNEIVNIINNDKIKFISPDVIKFTCTNEDLPKEMQEKITFMLSSSDRETFNLGWKILFEYNHISNINDFYLIISKANPRTYYNRTKSRVIEQKLKEIKQNFTNHRF